MGVHIPQHTWSENKLQKDGSLSIVWVLGNQAYVIRLGSQPFASPLKILRYIVGVTSVQCAKVVFNAIQMLILY